MAEMQERFWIHKPLFEPKMVWAGDGLGGAGGEQGDREWV